MCFDACTEVWVLGSTSVSGRHRLPNKVVPPFQLGAPRYGATSCESGIRSFPPSSSFKPLPFAQRRLASRLIVPSIPHRSDLGYESTPTSSRHFQESE